MALQGLIQDFGLADVLQISWHSGKSGWLHLENEVDEIIATIQDGWVMNVEAEPPRDSLLGRRLARNAVLSHAQLGAALRQRNQTQQGLAKILHDFGMVPIELLRQHATVIALDAIFEVFTWPAGTYKFVEGPVNPEGSWMEPIHIERLLTNGIWLVDEWRGLRERVPALEFKVVQRAALPEEQAEPSFDDAMFLGEQPSSPAVEENERVVHSLCLGHAVDALLDLSPFDRFETLKCVVHLQQAGYVGYDNPSLPPPLPVRDLGT